MGRLGVAGVNAAGEVLFNEAAHASNNWTIAPRRTATGRPILANDPHRNYAAPSLRYLVHLTAPGLDVIGAGEALYPGVMTGHNGAAAFGLTLFFGHDEGTCTSTKPGPAVPTNTSIRAGGRRWRSSKRRLR